MPIDAIAAIVVNSIFKVLTAAPNWSAVIASGFFQSSRAIKPCTAGVIRRQYSLPRIPMPSQCRLWVLRHCYGLRTTLIGARFYFPPRPRAHYFAAVCLDVHYVHYVHDCPTSDGLRFSL